MPALALSPANVPVSSIASEHKDIFIFILKHIAGLNVVEYLNSASYFKTHGSSRHDFHFNSEFRLTLKTFVHSL